LQTCEFSQSSDLGQTISLKHSQAAIPNAARSTWPAVPSQEPSATIRGTNFSTCSSKSSAAFAYDDPPKCSRDFFLVGLALAGLLNGALHGALELAALRQIQL
jgi:hypothetical protein